MTTVTVTAKGQVTLRKDLLEHLGAAPGTKLHVDKLPGGGLAVRRVRSSGSIADLFGTVRPTRSLSLKDIDRIATDGWSGGS
ncbi:MAG: AbrB/MazE/SpoVT family DNA-binding domain-containing protein [Pseudomonadota bacterium]